MTVTHGTATLQASRYGGKTTVVEDYDEIREILRSPDFEQAAFDVSGPHFLKDVLVMLDGPEHLDRRRIEARLFSEKALGQIKSEHLAPVVESVLQDLRRESDGPVQADLVPMIWEMLYRIAATVTGLDGVTTPEATKRLIGCIQAIGAALTVEWATDDPDAQIQRGLEQRDTVLREFFDPSYQRRKDLVARYRKGEIERADLPTDLITLLLLYWDDEWDEDLPFREVSLFLVGSTQTTAQAFPHFVVRFETWLENHPEYRDMIKTEPQLLRNAVYESLRLFVASPARLRRARRAVTLSTGRHIDEGEVVSLMFLAANQDPEVFGPDADVYNPLRELEDVPRWGLAFGGGQHACIGRPLVTGVSARDATDGTLVTMARALYDAGLRVDPTRPKTKRTDTFYDEYESVPVTFEPLIEESADA